MNICVILSPPHFFGKCLLSLLFCPCILYITNEHYWCGFLSFFFAQRFYLIGRDKNRTFSRVLKIDRSEPSELNVIEDPTLYTENECIDILTRINEGNKSTGGLKFVTTCYGIIGISYLLYYSKMFITILMFIPTLLILMTQPFYVSFCI
jgi:hypothetical protein